MDNTYLIRCGKLFDGVQSTLHEDFEILVNGKLIQDVGRGLSKPRGAETIDLSHLTVTPGLMDAHLHAAEGFTPEDTIEGYRNADSWYLLSAVHNLRKTLERGFTTVRMPSGLINSFGAWELKRAIEEGYFDSCSRFIVAGHCIGTTGNHADYSQLLASNPVASEAYASPFTGDGPAFMANAVRREIKHGCDFLKIMLSGGFYSPVDGPEDEQLTDEELKAIIDTAHGSFKSVTAHVYSPILMQKLVRFGLDCIEHGALMDEATARIIERSGVFVVPTFVPYDDVIDLDEEKLSEKPVYMQNKLRKYSEQLKESRKVIISSSIRLGYGTDIVSVYKCYDSYLEFVSWMKAGVDPFRILKAATSVNADICGISQLTGRIQPGKYADIAAWGKDLLTDPYALTDCAFVMKEGKVYPARPVEDA